ncbi:hypothetical protein V6N13_116707 [Hibiscus sabdariffa]
MHAPVARLPTRSRGLWPPRARVVGAARASDKSRVPPEANGFNSVGSNTESIGLNLFRDHVKINVDGAFNPVSRRQQSVLSLEIHMADDRWLGFSVEGASHSGVG